MVKLTLVYPYHGMLSAVKRNDQKKKKRNELLIHATVWLSGKGIMLMYKRESQEVTLHGSISITLS